MRCAQCGWPSEDATVLSTHHTSQGWIRYRRCVCGAVSIQLITLDEGQRQLRSAVTPRTHSAVASTVRAV